ncbi:Zn-ribbon domain-containing OB-fold protein [Nocardia xishanensis]
MEHYKTDTAPCAGETNQRRDRTTLMIRRCTSCATLLAPLTRTCSSCQSPALEWVSSSGEGSVVSWKVLHRPADSSSGEWETSTIAIVELDDGPWLYTTLEGEIPPPSDEPVRVRFEPQPTSDRFPVFTTNPPVDRPRAGTGRSECRHAINPKGRTVKAPTTNENTYDSTWVRSSLHQCDFLAATRSLDADERSLVRFAIRWAPFGGAGAGELLVTFGVTRWRFVQMISDALRPRTGDNQNVRTMKRNLLDALKWGWRVYPDSSVGHR